MERPQDTFHKHHNLLKKNKKRTDFDHLTPCCSKHLMCGHHLQWQGWSGHPQFVLSLFDIAHKTGKTLVKIQSDCSTNTQLFTFLLAPAKSWVQFPGNASNCEINTLNAKSFWTINVISGVGSQAFNQKIMFWQKKKKKHQHIHTNQTYISYILSALHHDHHVLQSLAPTCLNTPAWMFRAYL